MPTDNNKSPYKPTEWYAVVHFGPEGTDFLPCYLKRVPYKRVDGKIQKTYKHFTANMEKAALFNNIVDVEQAKEEVVGELTKLNHPLKDHIKVLQLFGLIREREN